jgi:hypothetical protein
MNNRAITQDFLTRLRGKERWSCCATQDAIDKLAVEFRQYGTNTRTNMFEVLGRTTDSQLCDLIMVAWAKAPLKLATDRSRDEWLVFFRNNLRPLD